MSEETELALARLFIGAHPDDAARVVERHPVAETSELLAALPPSESAPLVDQLAPTTAAECLAAMPAAQAADILGELSIDGAATLLRRLPDEAAARILDAAPQRVMTGALRMIIAFPEDTAGALLDPTVLALPSDVDARDALDRVLRDARYALYYVYAVDRQHRLVGVMSLRELMLAAPEKLLADIMHRDVERVRSTAGIGEIVAHPGWREHHALPVVEDSGTFLGVIRYGTLRRLEHAGTGLERRSPALDAAVSLSELYWHGVSALIDGVAAVAAISRAREAGARVEAQ